MPESHARKYSIDKSGKRYYYLQPGLYIAATEDVINVDTNISNLPPGSYVVDAYIRRSENDTEHVRGIYWGYEIKNIGGVDNLLIEIKYLKRIPKAGVKYLESKLLNPRYDAIFFRKLEGDNVISADAKNIYDSINKTLIEHYEKKKILTDEDIQRIFNIKATEDERPAYNLFTASYLKYISEENARYFDDLITSKEEKTAVDHLFSLLLADFKKYMESAAERYTEITKQLQIPVDRNTYMRIAARNYVDSLNQTMDGFLYGTGIVKEELINEKPFDIVKITDIIVDGLNRERALNSGYVYPKSYQDALNYYLKGIYLTYVPEISDIKLTDLILAEENLPFKSGLYLNGRYIEPEITKKRKGDRIIAKYEVILTGRKKTETAELLIDGIIDEKSGDYYRIKIENIRGLPVDLTELRAALRNEIEKLQKDGFIHVEENNIYPYNSYDELIREGDNIYYRDIENTRRRSRNGIVVSKEYKLNGNIVINVRTPDGRLDSITTDGYVIIKSPLNQMHVGNYVRLKLNRHPYFVEGLLTHIDEDAETGLPLAHLLVSRGKTINYETFNIVKDIASCEFAQVTDVKGFKAVLSKYKYNQWFVSEKVKTLIGNKIDIEFHPDPNILNSDVLRHGATVANTKQLTKYLLVEIKGDKEPRRYLLPLFRFGHKSDKIKVILTDIAGNIKEQEISEFLRDLTTNSSPVSRLLAIVNGDYNVLNNTRLVKEKGLDKPILVNNNTFTYIVTRFEKTLYARDTLHIIDRFLSTGELFDKSLKEIFETQLIGQNIRGKIGPALLRSKVSEWYKNNPHVADIIGRINAREFEILIDELDSIKLGDLMNSTEKLDKIIAKYSKEEPVKLELLKFILDKVFIQSITNYNPAEPLKAFDYLRSGLEMAQNENLIEEGVDIYFNTIKSLERIMQSYQKIDENRVPSSAVPFTSEYTTKRHGALAFPLVRLIVEKIANHQTEVINTKTGKREKARLKEMIKNAAEIEDKYNELKRLLMHELTIVDPVTYDYMIQFIDKNRDKILLEKSSDYQYLKDIVEKEMPGFVILRQTLSREQYLDIIKKLAKVRKAYIDSQQAVFTEISKIVIDTLDELVKNKYKPTFNISRSEFEKMVNELFASLCFSWGPFEKYSIGISAEPSIDFVIQLKTGWGDPLAVESREFFIGYNNFINYLYSIAKYGLSIKSFDSVLASLANPNANKDLLIDLGNKYNILGIKRFFSKADAERKKSLYELDEDRGLKETIDKKIDILMSDKKLTRMLTQEPVRSYDEIYASEKEIRSRLLNELDYNLSIRPIKGNPFAILIENYENVFPMETKGYREPITLDEFNSGLAYIHSELVKTARNIKDYEDRLGFETREFLNNHFYNFVRRIFNEVPYTLIYRDNDGNLQIQKARNHNLVIELNGKPVDIVSLGNLLLESIRSNSHLLDLTDLVNAYADIVGLTSSIIGRKEGLNDVLKQIEQKYGIEIKRVDSLIKRLAAIDETGRAKDLLIEFLFNKNGNTDILIPPEIVKENKVTREDLLRAFRYKLQNMFSSNESLIDFVRIASEDIKKGGGGIKPVERLFYLESDGEVFYHAKAHENYRMLMGTIKQALLEINRIIENGINGNDIYNADTYRSIVNKFSGRAMNIIRARGMALKTNITLEDQLKNFHATVSRLVDGIIDLTARHLSNANEIELYYNNLRKNKMLDSVEGDVLRTKIGNSILAFHNGLKALIEQHIDGLLYPKEMPVKRPSRAFTTFSKENIRMIKDNIVKNLNFAGDLRGSADEYLNTIGELISKYKIKDRDLTAAINEFKKSVDLYIKSKESGQYTDLDLLSDRVLKAYSLVNQTLYRIAADEAIKKINKNVIKRHARIFYTDINYRVTPLEAEKWREGILRNLGITADNHLVKIEWRLIPFDIWHTLILPEDANKTKSAYHVTAALSILRRSDGIIEIRFNPIYFNNINEIMPFVYEELAHFVHVNREIVAKRTALIEQFGQQKADEIIKSCEAIYDYFEILKNKWKDLYDELLGKIENAEEFVLPFKSEEITSDYERYQINKSTNYYREINDEAEVALLSVLAGLVNNGRIKPVDEDYQIIRNIVHEYIKILTAYGIKTDSDTFLRNLSQTIERSAYHILKMNDYLQLTRPKKEDQELTYYRLSSRTGVRDYLFQPIRLAFRQSNSTRITPGEYADIIYNAIGITNMPVPKEFIKEFIADYRDGFITPEELYRMTVLTREFIETTPVREALEKAIVLSLSHPLFYYNESSNFDLFIQDKSFAGYLPAVFIRKALITDIAENGESALEAYAEIVKRILNHFLIKASKYNFNFETVSAACIEESGLKDFCSILFTKSDTERFINELHGDIDRSSDYVGHIIELFTIDHKFDLLYLLSGNNNFISKDLARKITEIITDRIYKKYGNRVNVDSYRGYLLESEHIDLFLKYPLSFLSKFDGYFINLSEAFGSDLNKDRIDESVIYQRKYSELFWNSNWFLRLLHLAKSEIIPDILLAPIDKSLMKYDVDGLLEKIKIWSHEQSGIINLIMLLNAASRRLYYRDKDQELTRRYARLLHRILEGDITPISRRSLSHFDFLMHLPSYIQYINETLKSEPENSLRYCTDKLSDFYWNIIDNIVSPDSDKFIPVLSDDILLVDTLFNYGKKAGTKDENASYIYSISFLDDISDPVLKICQSSPYEGTVTTYWSHNYEKPRPRPIDLADRLRLITSPDFIKSRSKFLYDFSEVDLNKISTVFRPISYSNVYNTTVLEYFTMNKDHNMIEFYLNNRESLEPIARGRYKLMKDSGDKVRLIFPAVFFTRINEDLLKYKQKMDVDLDNQTIKDILSFYSYCVINPVTNYSTNTIELDVIPRAIQFTEETGRGNENLETLHYDYSRQSLYKNVVIPAEPLKEVLGIDINAPSESMQGDVPSYLLPVRIVNWINHAVDNGLRISNSDIEENVNSALSKLMDEIYLSRDEAINIVKSLNKLNKYVSQRAPNRGSLRIARTAIKLTERFDFRNYYLSPVYHYNLLLLSEVARKDLKEEGEIVVETFFANAYRPFFYNEEYNPIFTVEEHFLRNVLKSSGALAKQNISYQSLVKEANSYFNKLFRDLMSTYRELKYKAPPDGKEFLNSILRKIMSPKDFNEFVNGKTKLSLRYFEDAEIRSRLKEIGDYFTILNNIMFAASREETEIDLGTFIEFGARYLYDLYKIPNPDISLDECREKVKQMIISLFPEKDVDYTNAKATPEQRKITLQDLYRRQSKFPVNFFTARGYDSYIYVQTFNDLPQYSYSYIPTNLPIEYAATYSYLSDLMAHKGHFPGIGWLFVGRIDPKTVIITEIQRDLSYDKFVRRDELLEITVQELQEKFKVTENVATAMIESTLKYIDEVYGDKWHVQLLDYAIRDIKKRYPEVENIYLNTYEGIVTYLGAEPPENTIKDILRRTWVLGFKEAKSTDLINELGRQRGYELNERIKNLMATDVKPLLKYVDLTQLASKRYKHALPNLSAADAINLLSRYMPVEKIKEKIIFVHKDDSNMAARITPDGRIIINLARQYSEKTLLYDIFEEAFHISRANKEFGELWHGIERNVTNDDIKKLRNLGYSEHTIYEEAAVKKALEIIDKISYHKYGNIVNRIINYIKKFLKSVFGLDLPNSFDIEKALKFILYKYFSLDEKVVEFYKTINRSIINDYVKIPSAYSSPLVFLHDYRLVYAEKVPPILYDTAVKIAEMIKDLSFIESNSSGYDGDSYTYRYNPELLRKPDEFLNTFVNDIIRYYLNNDTKLRRLPLAILFEQAKSGKIITKLEEVRTPVDYINYVLNASNRGSGLSDVLENARENDILSSPLSDSYFINNKQPSIKNFYIYAYQLVREAITSGRSLDNILSIRLSRLRNTNPELANDIQKAAYAIYNSYNETTLFAENLSTVLDNFVREVNIQPTAEVGKYDLNKDLRERNNTIRSLNRMLFEGENAQLLRDAGFVSINMDNLNLALETFKNNPAIYDILETIKKNYAVINNIQKANKYLSEKRELDSIQTVLNMHKRLSDFKKETLELSGELKEYISPAVEKYEKLRARATELLQTLKSYPDEVIEYVNILIKAQDNSRHAEIQSSANKLPEIRAIANPEFIETLLSAAINIRATGHEDAYNIRTAAAKALTDIDAALNSLRDKQNRYAEKILEAIKEFDSNRKLIDRDSIANEIAFRLSELLIDNINNKTALNPVNVKILITSPLATLNIIERINDAARGNIDNVNSELINRLERSKLNVADNVYKAFKDLYDNNVIFRNFVNDILNLLAVRENVQIANKISAIEDLKKTYGINSDEYYRAIRDLADYIVTLDRGMFSRDVNAAATKYLIYRSGYDRLLSLSGAREILDLRTSLEDEFYQRMYDITMNNNLVFRPFALPDRKTEEFRITPEEIITPAHNEELLNKSAQYFEAAEDYVQGYETALCRYKQGIGEHPRLLGYDEGIVNGLREVIEEYRPIFAVANFMSESTLKPSRAIAYLSASSFFRQILKTSENMPGVFGLFLRQKISQLLEISRKLNAIEVSKEYQTFKLKRNNALFSHSEDPLIRNSLANYREYVFNPLAHESRDPYFEPYAGMELPSGVRVTREDIEFLKTVNELNRKYFNVIHELGEHRIMMETPEGIRTRKAISIGRYTISRRLNSLGLYVAGEIVETGKKAKQDRVVIADPNGSIDSKLPFVALFDDLNSKYDFYKYYIRDAARRNDIKFKPTQELMEAFRGILAAHSLPGKKLEISNMSELVALVAAEYHRWSDNPVRDAIKDLENNLTLIYNESRKIVQGLSEQNRKTVEVLLNMQNIKNEFTLEANELSLPSKFYDYGTVHDWDLTSLRLRTMAQPMVEIVSAFKMAAENLNAKLATVNSARTPEEREILAKQLFPDFDGDLRFVERMEEILRSVANDILRKPEYNSGIALKFKNALNLLTGAILVPPTVQIFNITGSAFAAFTLAERLSTAGAHINMLRSAYQAFRMLLKAPLYAGANLVKFAIDNLGESFVKGTFGDAIKYLETNYPKLYNALAIKCINDAITKFIYPYEEMQAKGYGERKTFRSIIGDIISAATEIKAAHPTPKTLESARSMVKQFLTATRVGAQSMFDKIGIRFWDAFINTEMKRYADYMIEDLKNLAIRYGENREKLFGENAKIDLTDVNWVIKPEEVNRILDADRVSTIGHLRNMMSVAGFQSLESLLWDYYRRYRENPDTDFFRDEKQKEKFYSAWITKVNKAWIGNRSINLKNNIWLSGWQWLKGYVTNFLLEMMNSFRRVPNNEAGKLASSILQLAALFTLSAFLGLLTLELRERYRRAFRGEIGPNPTVLSKDFWATGENAALNIFQAAMLNIPYIGPAALNVIGEIQGRRGFEPAAGFPVISFMTDFVRLMRAIMLTPFEDANVALRKYAERYLPFYREYQYLVGDIKTPSNYYAGSNAFKRGLKAIDTIPKRESAVPQLPDITPIYGIKDKIISSLIKGDMNMFMYNIERLRSYYYDNALKRGMNSLDAAREADEQVRRFYTTLHPAYMASRGLELTTSEYSKALDMMDNEMAARYNSSLRAWRRGAMALGVNPDYLPVSGYRQTRIDISNVLPVLPTGAETTTIPPEAAATPGGSITVPLGEVGQVTIGSGGTDTGNLPSAGDISAARSITRPLLSATQTASTGKYELKIPEIQRLNITPSETIPQKTLNLLNRFVRTAPAKTEDMVITPPPAPVHEEKPQPLQITGLPQSATRPVSVAQVQGTGRRIARLTAGTRTRTKPVIRKLKAPKPLLRKGLTKKLLTRK